MYVGIQVGVILDVAVEASTLIFAVVALVCDTHDDALFAIACRCELMFG